MPQIDLKDRKLIYYLSKDSRLSDTQLAKRVGLSKNAVRYRIRRMQKEGVIKGFVAVVNPGAASLSSFSILARFNADINQDPGIISFFRSHGLADWVITLSGHWDLFAEFIIRDLDEALDILKEVRAYFKERLNSYETYFSNDVLRVEHTVYDIYKDAVPERMQTVRKWPGRCVLDKVDRRILCQLNKDSSASFVALSKGLGLTMDVVRYRMKQLSEKGVLVKTAPELSLPKLGFTEYLYTLHLTNAPPDKLQELKAMIAGNENITYAFFDVVSSVIIFVCAYDSAYMIDSLARNLRNRFSTMISEQEYLLIREQVLFNMFPEGLVEEKTGKE